MKDNRVGAKSFMLALLGCWAILSAACTAHAGNGTWIKAGAGDWSDTSKWDGGNVASGAGSVAFFTNIVAAAVNQNVPGVMLGGLFFASEIGINTVTNGAINLDNNGSPAVITVGIRDAETTRAILATPLNGAGGVTKLGAGKLELTAATPGALAGPLTVSAGTPSSTATSGAPFGSGSVFLKHGLLDASPAGSGQTVSLAAASDNATNTFDYGPGGTTLSFAKGANNSVALTLGNAGAAAESVLKRADHGVLIIAPNNGTSIASLGATEQLLVNGGVATNTDNGMVTASIAGRNSDSGATGDFLTYGANGFEAAAYTEGLDGGATSIANVSVSTAIDTANVYALRVQSGTALTINSGETLTVGDGVHPAGVMLNNTGTVTTAINNGVLDFGTSEGIIYFNGINMNTGGAFPSAISSTLAGHNGITLAGVHPHAEIYLSTAGKNLYTGGTRILSGRVIVPKSGCLGTGDIYVLGHEGWGGQLYCFGEDITITNTLHLSGLAGHKEKGYWAGAIFGAIRVGMGIKTIFSGPVELLGDTRISASGITTIATFSGPIAGPWRLETGGEHPEHLTGTIVLTGTNTYTGGTRVHRGTLKIGTGGTLGTGPVENYAALVFDSAIDLDFTNMLSGAGALGHYGNSTLKIRNLPANAGPLTLNGTLDLCGASATFAALSGIGRVINPSAPPAVLTVGSANANTIFSGQVEGSITLVKTGTGTLTLVGFSSYSGATTVAGGNLKLSNGLEDIKGLSYRLDASDTAKVICVNSNVTEWADSNGSTLKFMQATEALQPVYVTNSINGLPAIRFGASASKSMVANISTAVQTVFIVNRMTSGAQGYGIWGQNEQDYGIRASSAAGWQHTTSGGNRNDFSWQGNMYINGVAGTTFVANQPHILTVVSLNAQNWITAVGHYFTSQTNRYFRGEIGEMLVYNRVLGTIEHQTVENYLANKWLGGAQPLPVPNQLPVTTALSISNNAAVDLNGINQSVVSLSGEGTLRNSNEKTCILTVGADNANTVFDGKIEGALSLVKTGTGTLTLNGMSSASGATVVQGGTLKLRRWLPAAGLSYWLDATDAAKLTLSGSNVTEWADSNGSDLKFTQTTTALQPVYVTNAINGYAAVRFGNPTTRKRMAANMSTNAQTAFIVYRMSSFSLSDGIWGQDMEDYGIRATGLSSWQSGANANDFTYQGQMYIDGRVGNTFTAYQPHILTAVSPNAVTCTNAIGNYWGVSHGLARYFRGDIGEIIVYDRTLSTEERKSVEAYLTLKWFESGVTSGLATNATVTVAAGATLDLNGQAQTLAGLGGGGSVINGTITISGQTSPGGDDSVGTLSLSPAPALSGTLLIDVCLDGTCDRLEVSGDLNISQLALAVADTAQLSPNSIYTIATCTGDLAGEFTTDNLPLKKWAVRYIRTPGAGKILLTPWNGTVILIR